MSSRYHFDRYRITQRKSEFNASSWNESHVEKYIDVVFENITNSVVAGPLIAPKQNSTTILFTNFTRNFPRSNLDLDISDDGIFSLDEQDLIFKEMDKDGDGRIGKSDFSTVYFQFPKINSTLKKRLQT